MEVGVLFFPLKEMTRVINNVSPNSILKDHPLSDKTCSLLDQCNSLCAGCQIQVMVNIYYLFPCYGGICFIPELDIGSILPRILSTMTSKSSFPGFQTGLSHPYLEMASIESRPFCMHSKICITYKCKSFWYWCISDGGRTYKLQEPSTETHSEDWVRPLVHVAQPYTRAIFKALVSIHSLAKARKVCLLPQRSGRWHICSWSGKLPAINSSASLHHCFQPYVEIAEF